MGRSNAEPKYPTVELGTARTVLEIQPWPTPGIDPRLADGLRFVFTALAARGLAVGRVSLRLGCAGPAVEPYAANAAEILALDGLSPDVAYLGEGVPREQVKALQGLWEEWEFRDANEGPHFVRRRGRIVMDRAPTPTLWFTVRAEPGRR